MAELKPFNLFNFLSELDPLMKTKEPVIIKNKKQLNNFLGNKRS